MLGKKGMALVAALFVAMVLLTGQARLALDDMTASFRNDFREMLYLPRGRSLKLIACGFDSPLADALFIKAMVYFGESIADDNKIVTGRRYTYELFDVVTDLSPRFSRAYQIGSVLLGSSADFDTKLKSVKLLDKGVATFDRLAAANERFIEDPRWLFHSLLATTYDVDVQIRKRREGDLDAAAEARENAAKHFRLAAVSAGAPPYVVAAAAGYERYQRGLGQIESLTIASLSIWGDMYEQAKARGDKDILPELEERISISEKFLQNIADTRALQEGFSRAGKKFLETNGRLPRGVAELVEAGLVPRFESYPLDPDDGEDMSRERFLVMPDGALKSRKLAALEAISHTDMLFDGIMRFRRTMGRPPSELSELVEANFLDRIPTPPLEKIGQHYAYNRETGAVLVQNPLGPEPPPSMW